MSPRFGRVGLRQMVSGDRTGETQGRSPTLQRFRPSELWASKHGAGRYSRKAFHADWLWGAHVHNFSSHRFAGRRFGWRIAVPNDRLSGSLGVLASTYWSSAYLGVTGGEGGIRTPDTLSGMPVFKTGAINHSATSPATTVLLQSQFYGRSRTRSGPIALFGAIIFHRKSCYLR